MLGTPYFMAPEIVRGEAVPSIIADRHALAVVLFYLLLRHHPLFGAREHALHDLTPDSLRTLLGEQPLFIFDPDDQSNRPVSRRRTTRSSSGRRCPATCATCSPPHSPPACATPRPAG